MPASIRGPLYYEVMGPRDAPPMVMVHPNPMDNAWAVFQMAHFSTWFRTIAVDLPGYGRSPSASDTVCMPDIAQACWEAVDQESEEPGVLQGCSVGANVVQHMYHLRPQKVDAVVIAGGGGYHDPADGLKPHCPRRIAEYRELGLTHRWDHTFQDFSPEFAATPLAQWFADLFAERNSSADLATIIAMFDALGQPDPEWLIHELHAPVLVLTGSEDRGHARSFELQRQLPDAELVTVQGAGHACQIEQPWVVDREIIRFLSDRGLWPSSRSTALPHE